MSSEWELDEGIKSIKSAWRREHTARCNLEKMLKQTEAENIKLRKEVVDLQKSLQTYEFENAKLRELAGMMLGCFMDSLPDSTEKPCDLCDMWGTCNYVNDRQCRLLDSLRELGVEMEQ